MKDVNEWLVDWFIENTDVDKEDILIHVGESYFELGYIDSFQFISLISDIEEAFDVEFENDQFEDRSFSTISGMAKIIERVMANGKN